MSWATQSNAKQHPFRGREGRQSFRVPCRFPVYYRLISEVDWPGRIQCEPENPRIVLIPPQPHYLYWADHFLGILPVPPHFEGFLEQIAGGSKYGSSAQEKIYQGLVLDLSGDGLRLQPQEPLRLGQGLRLAIVLPSAASQLWEILAQVVWINQQDCRAAGIKFVNLAKFGREQLISFVFSQQRQLLRGQSSGI